MKRSNEAGQKKEVIRPFRTRRRDLHPVDGVETASGCIQSSSLKTLDAKIRYRSRPGTSVSSRRIELTASTKVGRSRRGRSMHVTVNRHGRGGLLHRWPSTDARIVMREGPLVHITSRIITGDCPKTLPENLLGGTVGRIKPPPAPAFASPAIEHDGKFLFSRSAIGSTSGSPSTLTTPFSVLCSLMDRRPLNHRCFGAAELGR